MPFQKAMPLYLVQSACISGSFRAIGLDEFERAAHLHPTLRGSIPALGREVRGMQITLNQHFVTALGERHQPAERDRGFMRVKFAEGGTIAEVDAPLLLDVRTSPHAIIGIGVRVPANPEVDRPGSRGEILFEGLGVGFFVDPI